MIEAGDSARLVERYVTPLPQLTDQVGSSGRGSQTQRAFDFN